LPPLADVQIPPFGGYPQIRSAFLPITMAMHECKIVLRVRATLGEWFDMIDFELALVTTKSIELSQTKHLPD
jgi:hypothetical protein